MRSLAPRRILCAALSILAVLTMPACQRRDEGTTDVTVIGDPPQIVDPAAGPLTQPQAVLLANVAQGLVRFDASGQVVPGLAERWNVTDDGLSYIFRLQTANWPDGRKITAQQIARLLKRQIAGRSANPLKDTLGAIDEITATTDRVIEMTLRAPRPNLLALLAQPELAIVYQGQGTGPFAIARGGKPPTLNLVRTVSDLDAEVSRREEVVLAAAPVADAVRAFVDGKTDLVLGGTFADLPYARAQRLPRNALRFDPAAGLFGLLPARSDGPFADADLRRLLSAAIDRQALIDALNVPGLLPRATILEPGLDGTPNPAPPQWAAVPIDQRRADLGAQARRRLGSFDHPVVRLALPDSPGSRVLLSRLATDWGALGLRVEAAAPGQPADFQLFDAVAPSNSSAWYLRQFRCERSPICDQKVDELLDGARNATVPAQRYALLAQAAQLVDQEQLFIPLTAPIRWSLVSDRVQGFATNRVARHSLTGLRQRLDQDRGE
jgi:oligopeptide transport system substrate-binding protein